MQVDRKSAAAPSANGRGSVAVLGKASALLDFIAAEGEPTPGRLAELAGEPRSTVYRLLATLQELELVEAGPRRGTYVLGLRLFRLGSAVVSRFDVRQAALPVMERVHEETGETTFLCVARGDEAVCIERIDGKQVNLLALRLGGSMLLHTGSAPRAILAFQPPETWDTYLDKVELEAFTPKSFTTRDAVIEELRATRDRGYAVSDEDVTLGVASVGVPIFDHRGAVKASVSVGGLRDPILGKGSQVLALARDAAAEISRSLGHEHGGG